MDYEKKYKEALSRAATELETCGADKSLRNMIYAIFPDEIKESEDEKIRKALVDALNKNLGNGIEKYGTTLNAALTWLEKQGKSSDQIHYWTEEEIEPIISDYLRGAEHYGGMIGRLRCLKPKSLEKQDNSSIKWQKNTPHNKPAIKHSVLMKTTQGIAEGEWQGEDWFQYRWSWTLKESNVLAWMELSDLDEQGVQKPIMNVPTREVILSIWDLGNEWKELTNGSISTEYGTQLDYIQKHWYESEYYLREKQDEQKSVLDFKASNWYVSKVDGKIHDMTYNPTDKVEPKFKVGDYIVYGYCMGRVFEITNDAYLLDTGQDISFSREDNVHLWTIQDAKDGDVLAGNKGDVILMFRRIGNTEYNDVIDYHCYYDCYWKEFIVQKDLQYWGDTNNNQLKPATKEQCDLLFTKMKEAGYEWNAEKKELKKIEQKLEEKPLISLKDFQEAFELKARQYDIELPNRGYDIHAMCKELYSLLIQPKQEWSEEDEAYKEFAISAVEDYYDEENPLQKELVGWLKSIKDRLSWKPNKKQMETLEYYMHTLLATEHKEVLFGLYNDLKKL